MHGNVLPFPPCFQFLFYQLEVDFYLTKFLRERRLGYSLGQPCIISVILCIYFFEVCVLHICMRKHEEIIYRAQIAIHDVRTPSDSFIIPSCRTENSLDALLSLSPAHTEIIFLLISPRRCGQRMRKPFALQSDRGDDDVIRLQLFYLPNLILHRDKKIAPVFSGYFKFLPCSKSFEFTHC